LISNSGFATETLRPLSALLSKADALSTAAGRIRRFVIFFDVVKSGRSLGAYISFKFITLLSAFMRKGGVGVLFMLLLLLQCY
jgi:hypothetical protein